jgi:hypothetical protein
MTRTAVLLIALAIAFAMLGALPADAQQTYTAVSASAQFPGGGPSGGQCGKVSNPCRTLQEAYNVTAVGGEIDVLTPGEYGPLTITHAINIQGHGFASITVSSGDAIDITAASTTSSTGITLSGLTLQGGGTGAHGIFLTSALSGNATVNILDCVVASFNNSGIAIEPTGGEVFLSLLIANTSSLNNGQNGIKVAASTEAEVQGTITGSIAANNNQNGFDFEGNSSLTVVRSAASANYNYGIYTNLAILDNPLLITRDTTASGNAIDYYGAGPNTGPPQPQAFLTHNTIGSYYSSDVTAYSDGTNDIMVLSSGAPTVKPTY